VTALDPAATADALEAMYGTIGIECAPPAVLDAVTHLRALAAVAGRVPHADREALAARLDAMARSFDGQDYTTDRDDCRAAAAELRRVDAREAAVEERIAAIGVALGEYEDNTPRDEHGEDMAPHYARNFYVTVLAEVAAYRALTEEPGT
jgi:hypothetical protein